ncbi:hypothetical protein [Actinomadura madurae]|uniref:hypothetical protein n=1 Tax=Actinomadura madurae TaxID=1993 RepID=UPI0020D2062E|nr:hypothetical protein [Actinomadura madurae]MCP9951575.1 hypothetical protein [Actinomadura madurae]MCP9968347.1 hypothetical protein [Actinomadura madurae]MCP9980813.1 hypothetical protein [Actinomadura madurae]
MTSTAGQQDAAVGDVVDPVVSPKDTPILNDDNKFKLVLLSLNTGRGTTLSHGAGTLRITWDETVRIAQAAERAASTRSCPSRTGRTGRGRGRSMTATGTPSPSRRGSPP